MKDEYLYSWQKIARNGRKTAIYQVLFFHELAKVPCGFWINKDLDMLSASKWPSESQFCERWRYTAQKNGQIWSYNCHLWVIIISKQSLLKLTESEKKELSYFLSLCFHKEVYFKTTKVREISSDKSVVNMNMHFRNYFNLSISTHWRQRKNFNEKSILCPTFLGLVHCIIVDFWGKKTRLKYFSLYCTVVESLCSFNWGFFARTEWT